MPHFSCFRNAVSLLLLGAGLGAAVAVVADDVRLEGEEARVIFERIQAVRPDLPMAAVERSAAEGLYTLVLEDGSVLHTTADGRFLISGDLYEITEERIVNRTEDRRGRERIKELEQVAGDEMIVFAANGERRGMISVFTDVDCGFCQRLHNEVPELNRMGIEVRYLAYPRAGIGSGSYDKHVSAWCASDPQTAITRLKAGQTVEKRNCANPVSAQFRLGQALGVRGTPAIFLEDGRYLPGYMPAAELARELGL